MNVSAKTRRFFSKCRQELGLWVLGVLVALTLCGAEAVKEDVKIILAPPDQFAHFKLVDSTVLALERGQFPVRAAEGLNGDLGTPRHQFYSPGTHMVMAAFVFITGNLFIGVSYSIVFMMALAFVYAQKLSSYLTCSRIWGLVGAFLFISGPYLHINRVTRGALAEYFAMCLMPLLVYWQLRLLARFTAGRWAAVVLAWALMLHFHLITATFLIFFFIVFWGLHGLFVFDPVSAITSRLKREYLSDAKTWIKAGLVLILLCAWYMWTIPFTVVVLSAVACWALYAFYVSAPGRSKSNRPVHNYLARTGTWLAVGANMVLVSAWHLWPVVFYGDLRMKTRHIWPAHDFWEPLTPVMSLFSLTDMLWATTNLATCRYQVGLFLLAGFFGFIYLRWRETSSKFIWPLGLVSILVLVMIVSPFNLLVFPPLRYLDIAQFTYRYLAQFQLLCTILSILALKALAEKNSWMTRPFKISTTLTIIVGAMVLTAPYLYPPYFYPDHPREITKKDVRECDVMPYFPSAYFRNFNPETADPAVPDGWITAKEMTNAADRLFEVDLAQWANAPQWHGRLAFNVLYYPELQSIEVKLNGREIQPTLSTTWKDRSEKEKIHLLMLSNLPDAGKLTVRVRFIGSRIGNWLSMAGVSLIFAAMLWSIWTRRLKKALSSYRVTYETIQR